ncbi:hypothetical protein BLS_004627 [Venturia inaequalis]|uniref:Heterokaryon incompatibility domain-containing protein n=1 Tax=Venturia inaequalis TaxID=5025 RepID=A0A8H3UIZ4_VENIN|nr:hypothetical protein BLS_004627 [Venturia inaequalis]
MSLFGLFSKVLRPARDLEETVPPLSQPRRTLEHTEINIYKQEFRLLRILPTRSKSTIKLEVKTFDFGPSCPPFTALSYTWGDPESEQDIEINGCSFPARHNLRSFLLAAGSFQLTHWLWIDAICIDQTNVIERNHQVELMGDIYGLAQDVLVWLGDAADESDYIMEIIQQIKSVSPYIPWKCCPRDDRNLKLPLLKKKELAKFVSSSQGLLSRPYWRRMWIVQEVILASKVSIACGMKVVAWDKMLLFSEAIAVTEDSKQWHGIPCILAHIRITLPLISEYACALAIFSRRPNSQKQAELSTKGKQNFELRVLLLTFHDFQCQDFRDRVYGLLNLAKNEARIPVDYNKSRYELYIAVVEKVVVTEPNLDEILFVQFCRWIEIRWNLEKIVVQKLIQSAFWKAARWVSAHDLQAILAKTHEPFTLEDLRVAILQGQRSLLDSRTVRIDHRLNGVA